MATAGDSRHPLPRIVVVGLGPGGEAHVTAETLDLIGRIPRRHLRTAVHPTAHFVPDAIAHDDAYERADSFAAVYAAITDRLIADAAEHGEILYAVPGSPLVLERTVGLLRERSAAGEVELDVRPAMSFLDVAWSRLGVDPVDAGVRLVDAHEFATSAAGERGPLLVAHVHADWVLSEIKLAADDPAGDRNDDDDPAGTHDPANDAVILLQALGTDDERIVETTWSELDRTIDADHLTSLYVPRLATPIGEHYVRFHQLTRTLRERCPWDIEQTHASLVPHLLEETYEVVDALQALDPDDPASDEHLIEELGDLLYQIEFHAVIAEQEGRFTIADVAQGIHDKLVRRHPHVFGGPDAEHSDMVEDIAGALDTSTVLSNWEAIKRAEKGRTSVFDGIPRSMPALSYAAKLGKKASKAGFDWDDVSGALPKVPEELDELQHVIDHGDADAQFAEFGDLLFASVNVARHLGIDPELALRTAADKFRRRFETVERLAAARSLDLTTCDLPQLDALWEEVKADEARGTQHRPGTAAADG